jgi:hypothetical protein
MDSIITFNENDSERLKIINKNTICAPFAIPDALIYKQKASKIFDKFVFSAVEGHTPNAYGLTWFLDFVYIPNINRTIYPIYIIGDWSKQYKKKYKQYKKIIFCGFVETIQPYFENSILVNPILSGAGIRMKVLHAFANKVPVFSTRFGAEGCYTKNEMAHLHFFDSAEEFMHSIEAADNAFWENLAIAGNNYYKRKFDKVTLLSARMEIYNRLLSTP